MNACVDFYTDLYTDTAIDENVKAYFLLEPNLRKLDNFESETLEGPITKTECINAIKSMLNDKSPGLDGLTKEFYSAVFHYIGDSFVEMVNNCHVNNLLSCTQRTSLITLI